MEYFVVLILGLLLLTVYVSYRFKLQERHRKQLEALIEERTKELEFARGEIMLVVDTLTGYFYRDVISDLSKMGVETTSMPVYMTNGVEKLTGYSVAELDGKDGRKTFPELMHPDDGDMVWEKAKQAVAAHQEFKINYRIFTRDGEERWVYERGHGIYDENGEAIYLEGYVIDDNERKKSETELDRYREHLEDLVEERTKELKQQTIELERATRLKSEFLANMSHELRTPMNSIIGFTRRVITKAEDKLEPRQLKNLHTVERNARHLLGLLNSLLDLSKIEAGKMEVHTEDFDLVEMTNEVINLTQSLVDDKPIELIVSIPGDAIKLNTDQVKLKQILINLVSNSIKFTGKGAVTISVELLNHQPETHIAIRVTDTGIGMSDEAQQYIFQAFRQVDGAMTRKVGGTGLGLALVSKFTDLLGGTISVKSEEGVGTCFQLVIPIKLDQEGAIPKQTEIPSEEYTGDEKIILCIDDEAEALELLNDYLTDEGYHVVTTTSAEEGLALAKQIKPLAITLDILMPSKDGWSVLSELKSSDDTRDIPVMVISFLDNQTLGYQLGAFDYMQKPIDPEQLIRSIKSLGASKINTALVVDDHPEARELIIQILEDAKISCDPAVDGHDALAVLKKLDKKLPEIIMLDLMMPGMDGFELLQRLHQNPDWANIPVIVVTAKSLVEHDFDFLRPRVASILSKEGLGSEQVLEGLRVVMRQFDKKANKLSSTVGPEN